MPAPRPSDNMPNIYDPMKEAFTDALTNERSHTRNCAALFALHCAVVCRGEPMDCGGKEGGYEFMECFLYFLGQCLHMQAARPAELGLRFVAAYVEYLNDSVGQIGHNYLQFYPQDRGEPGPSSSSTPGPSTSTSTPPLPTHDPAPWFTGRVLKALKHALAAPTQTTRRRAIDTVARMFGTLGAIDARVVDKVRAAVRGRLGDRDRVVRRGAAELLCRHMAMEDRASTAGNRASTAEATEDETLLIESMACDPAVDVRLAVVSYIPITENTIPHLLLRSRDDGRDEKGARKGRGASGDARKGASGDARKGASGDARVRVAVYRRLREDIAAGARGRCRDSGKDARQNGAILDKLNNTVIDKLLAYGFDDRSEDVRREVAKLVAPLHRPPRPAHAPRPPHEQVVPARRGGLPLRAAEGVRAALSE
ncbi:hypothetical protein K523DRAFT_271067 [Schizophyllum commune Tattone D]|nr:hypothetical protein K523DRAFT_271067 [Schizophyllum commune Tattone D]